MLDYKAIADKLLEVYHKTDKNSETLVDMYDQIVIDINNGEYKTAPLPRKEVISIQRQRAMDAVNEAIETAKEVYKESIKKHSTVTCCDIIRNIKDLTAILMTLEVYREQEKHGKRFPTYEDDKGDSNE